MKEKNWRTDVELFLHLLMKYIFYITWDKVETFKFLVDLLNY